MPIMPAPSKPKTFEITPSQWRKYHMGIIGAHVVQVPAPSLFSLLRLDSVPINPSLSDCVTTGDLRKPQHSELHESMVSLAVAVEFLSVPTPLGDFSD